MEPEKERGRRTKRKKGSKPRSFPSPFLNKGDCLSGQDVKAVLWRKRDKRYNIQKKMQQKRSKTKVVSSFHYLTWGAFCICALESFHCPGYKKPLPPSDTKSQVWLCQSFYLSVMNTVHRTVAACLGNTRPGNQCPEGKSRLCDNEHQRVRQCVNKTKSAR